MKRPLVLISIAGASLLSCSDQGDPSTGPPASTALDGSTSSDSSTDSPPRDSGLEASDSESECLTLDDPLNCGECGRSCLGSECHQARCEPIELYSPSANNVIRMAIRDNFIYWTDAYGWIRKVHREGGASTVLAENDDERATGIAVSDDTVFWVNYFSGDLRSIPADGGTLRTIINLAGNPDSITVHDGEAVLYVITRSSGQLLSVDRKTGEAESLADNEVGANAIVSDAKYVVWSNSDTGDIRALSKSDKSVMTIAAGEGVASRVGALRDGKVFWSSGNSATGAVMAAAILPSASVVRLISAKGIRATAVTSSHLYWSTPNAVWKAAGDGSNSLLLATEQDEPASLLLDESWLYFANFNGGGIHKIAK